MREFHVVVVGAAVRVLASDTANMYFPTSHPRTSLLSSLFNQYANYKIFQGTAIAEWFRDAGKHALIVYDDLSKSVSMKHHVSLHSKLTFS